MWRKSWCILAVLAGLAVAGPAAARVYPVKDQADLIQDKATLEKLNQLIREIDQKFGKEVLIETFASVPAGDVNRVKAMDKDARKQYFFEQARSRALRHRVNGFYIFVNKSPVTSLEVLEGDKTDQALPIEREVRDIMLTHFSKKEYDAGFLKGVEFIRNQLAAHPPARGAAPVGRPRAAPQAGETNWAGIICIGAVVLLVVWLIVGMMRGRSAAGGGMAGAGGGGGGGGGGFMTGMLGGLFGAVAGNWLYHNFFGGGSGWGSQAYGDSSNPGDTDYTGSGGDWDDGGGGGGGGDAGGGDWGGGGGGGGDWGGGGGGDW